MVVLVNGFVVFVLVIVTMVMVVVVLLVLQSYFYSSFLIHFDFGLSVFIFSPLVCFYYFLFAFLLMNGGLTL